MTDHTKFILSTLLTISAIVFHTLWCIKHKRDIDRIRSNDSRDRFELEKIIYNRHRIGTYVASFVFLILMNIIFKL